MTTSVTAEACGALLKPLGFKLDGNTFRRKHGEFYQIINLQSGAHGGGYYFINLGVHPVGLPELLSGRLEISNNPKEYECILRARVEQAIPESPFTRFKESEVYLEDAASAHTLASALADRGVDWLNAWSQPCTVLKATDNDLSGMLTVVPILRTKALAMLRAYMNIIHGKWNDASLELNHFHVADSHGWDFDAVEEYLKGRLQGNFRDRFISR